MDGIETIETLVKQLNLWFSTDPLVYPYSTMPVRVWTQGMDFRATGGLGVAPKGKKYREFPVATADTWESAVEKVVEEFHRICRDELSRPYMEDEFVFLADNEY